MTDEEKAEAGRAIFVEAQKKLIVDLLKYPEFLFETGKLWADIAEVFGSAHQHLEAVNMVSISNAYFSLHEVIVMGILPLHCGVALDPGKIPPPTKEKCCAVHEQTDEIPQSPEWVAEVLGDGK